MPPTLKEKITLKSILAVCSRESLTRVYMYKLDAMFNTHGLSSVSSPTVIASQAELKPSLAFKLLARFRCVRPSSEGEELELKEPAI